MLYSPQFLKVGDSSCSWHRCNAPMLRDACASNLFLLALTLWEGSTIDVRHPFAYYVNIPLPAKGRETRY